MWETILLWNLDDLFLGMGRENVCVCKYAMLLFELTQSCLFLTSTVLAEKILLSHKTRIPLLGLKEKS
jgi:hypothetical protein